MATLPPYDSFSLSGGGYTGNYRGLGVAPRTGVDAGPRITFNIDGVYNGMAGRTRINKEWQDNDEGCRTARRRLITHSCPGG
jgi:hypothetical protein